MCLDFVLSIVFLEMAVFLLKIQRYAQLMEEPRKIVLCDSNLVIIDTKKKIHISQSFIIFDNESCFLTHLQHNYLVKNVERQYVTSPEMRMTSVISLHSNVTSITS